MERTGTQLLGDILEVLQRIERKLEPRSDGGSAPAAAPSGPVGEPPIAYTEFGENSGYTQRGDGRRVGDREGGVWWKATKRGSGCWGAWGTKGLVYASDEERSTWELAKDGQLVFTETVEEAERQAAARYHAAPRDAVAVDPDDAPFE